MKGQAPLEPRHIVLLVHGPASVTKSAYKRARRLAGRDGTVSIVPGTAEAAALASRYAGGALVSEAGAAGLTAVAAASELPLVVLHDDASIGPAGVEALVSRLGPDAPIVAAAAGGQRAEFCFAVLAGVEVAGHPSALAGAPTVDVEVRHDLRCGLEPPRRPRVVASMIVRDEEETLAECLESLANFADRVVVCDTGSTDRTIEIARAFGAEVIQTEWTDDFAAARNVALQHARDGEFVLWIDADERLEVEDADAVRAALAGENHPETYLVEVESIRAGGPTTLGLAQRLFRPDGLRFEGAIHEELRRNDGTSPTGARFPHVRILHVGYHPVGGGEDAAKRARNLGIARRQHAASPSAKSALDLARSLAYAGAPPHEVVAVLDDGLGLAGAGELVRARMLTMRAGLAFDSGDPATALEYAREAFNIDPGDDAAAALAARAGVELGQDEAALEVGEGLTQTGALRVPRNEAIAYAYAAAAGLRTGRGDDAHAWLQRAAEILDEADDRWHVLLSALGMVETDVARSALQSLSEVDPAALAAAARDLGDLELANIFAGAAAQSADPPSPTGITLAFGGVRLPVDADRLAAVCPSRRRVLTWTDAETLVERLRGQCRSLTVSTATDILAGAAVPPGSTVDVAIGGVELGAGPDVFSSLRTLVDPAGIVIVWPQDRTGNALTGPAAVEPIEQLHRSLSQAGFLAEPEMPLGVVAGRPVWNDASFAAAGPGPREECVASVRIVSDTPIPEELQMAYRASVPGSYLVEFGKPPSGADAPDVTLVTDPSIMPDPRWVQAVVDCALERGTTCGVTVIDQSGRIVQAGVDEQGRAVAAGGEAASPLYATSRPACRLLPPYAVPRGATPGPHETIGTLLGSPPAITLLDSAGESAATTVQDLFPRPVLLLGGPAPGSAPAGQQAELEKLVDRLVDDGRTVVYQWDDAGAAVDPWQLAAWRRRGVVAFPPSPLRREPGRFTPDLARPRADALVTAFRPEVVVYLSAAALEWDYAAVAAVGAGAATVYAGPTLPAHLRARADITCGLADLADEILSSSPPSAVLRPEIPSVEVVAPEPGLVSIVIPVHNRWDLTASCLDSIAAHTPQPHEIILVDNGSTDATAIEAATRAARVITNPVNRGFPAAVNQGIAAARGEFVCILNNDTEVTAGWMEAMLKALSIEGTGLVGPRSNEVGGLQRVPGAPPLADGPAARDWARRWRAGSAQRTWQIERLIGFCLVARRDTFERFGGFDEAFGIGNYEDDELGRRLRRHGLNLRVADGAVVLHHGSATFESLDLDYAALIHSGARRYNAGDHPSVHTVALVLSDGSAADAAAAAATALPVTGRVVIAERGSLAATQLGAAAVPGGAIDVVSCDWADAAAAGTLMESVDAQMVLVMGASERLQLADWGAARAEIEELGLRPAEVRTSSGSEVRLVPAARDAVEAVGTQSTSRARYFGFA